MPIVTGDLKLKKSLHVVAAGVDNGNTNDLEVGSLGLGVDMNADVTSVINSLFDPISSSEAITGKTDYRCVYVVNDHGSLSLYDAKIYLSANTISDKTKIEIGVDPVAVNGENSEIALDNEHDTTNKLDAVMWGEHASFSDGISIGTLEAGKQRAIWIKRTVEAGAVAVQGGATIAFVGDTDE